MVQPLKFRDAMLLELPEPAALLATLGEAVKTTHRITQAGDASQIPLPMVIKHVLSTLGEIVKAEVRQPLIDMFDAHLQAVEEEYELLEGEAPDVDGVVGAQEAAHEWWKSLFAAQIESLTGDATNILGADAVRKLVEDDASTVDIVDAILAKPIVAHEEMLVKLNLTLEDITPIVQGIHSNWSSTGTTISTMTTASDGEKLLNEGGFLSKATIVDGVVTQVQMTHAGEAYKGPALASVSEAPKPRGLRQKSVASPTTEAARAMIEALCEHSGAKEADIAEALGVSRPQINNYRHGKTALEPSETQVAGLLTLARKHVSALDLAAQAFEVATL